MDLVELAPRGVVGNEEERERSRGTGIALTGRGHWTSSLSEALEFEDFSWQFQKKSGNSCVKKQLGNSEIVSFFWGGLFENVTLSMGNLSDLQLPVGDNKGPSPGTIFLDFWHI